MSRDTLIVSLPTARSGLNFDLDQRRLPHSLQNQNCRKFVKIELLTSGKFGKYLKL